MKHNKNIYYLSAISLLLFVVCQINATTKMIFSNVYITNLIKFGEELGVFIFFFISGYSIYKILDKKITNYTDYVKNVLKKISPHYYISIIICLLFTGSVVYLNKNGLTNLISHTFFFHNLFYTCYNTINGVLWVIGIIFQFFLIAPIFKKMIDKYPKLTYVFSLALSLFFKWLIYYIILPKNNLDTTYYMVYGKQLFTTLDMFILGMIISKIEDKNKLNNFWNILFSLFFIITIIFIALIGSNTFNFLNDSIYAMNVKGLFYFYILDAIIAIFIFFFVNIKFKPNIVLNILTFISQHGYSLFIWHLVLLTNLVNNNPVLMKVILSSNWKGYLILLLLLIIITYVIDIVIKEINFSKIYDLCKEEFYKLKKYIISFIVFAIFIIALSYIPRIYKNFTVNNFIHNCQGACVIAENVKKEMVCENRPCKYLYIDTEDMGYLYYNHLRYYLYPNTSRYYNTYFYVINYGSDKGFMDFIKKQDADYVIVRNNEKLKEYNYELDLTKGKLFTINHEAMSILDLLKEVG